MKNLKKLAPTTKGAVIHFLSALCFAVLLLLFLYTPRYDFLYQWSRNPGSTALPSEYSTIFQYYAAEGAGEGLAADPTFQAFSLAVLIIGILQFIAIKLMGLTNKKLEEGIVGDERDKKMHEEFINKFSKNEMNYVFGAILPLIAFSPGLNIELYDLGAILAAYATIKYAIFAIHSVIRSRS